ncbi:cell division cycle-associated protein 3-like [Brachionichthys hirsutus]|uniref:cell division cycle-associated protein 3-like n=1 Tax=Brachionichthys hirsutus TaxID=412623 RepID=UPI003604E88A
MGSFKSKEAESSPAMPQPAIKNNRVSRLMDPRSPSTEVDRTPIQVNGLVPKAVADAKAECPGAFTDPRSPTFGVTRTPVRDIIRATVGSYARRLGLLFHNEAEGKVPQKDFKGEELASTDSLQPPLKQCSLDSEAEQANLLVTPVMPPLQSVADASPFVLLQQPQFEVELETEDLSLEEAEEAKESPLHKRLSLSLITCREGATSSQVYAEVHYDGASSPVPSPGKDLPGDGVDHSYALPLITLKTESDEPTVADCSPAQVSEEAEHAASTLPSAPTLSDQLNVLRLAEPRPDTSIHRPFLEAGRSPSTVVLKPQWLGKGFGATGQRARGVQGYGGRGSSSALAVAVKNMANEKVEPPVRRIQTGTHNEGRSPLQILRETNSPRIQRPQKKLKVSTPDRQRLGQMDLRTLSVSFDKENR